MRQLLMLLALASGAVANAADKVEQTALPPQGAHVYLKTERGGYERAAMYATTASTKTFHSWFTFDLPGEVGSDGKRTQRFGWFGEDKVAEWRPDGKEPGWYEITPPQLAPVTTALAAPAPVQVPAGGFAPAPVAATAPLPAAYSPPPSGTQGVVVASGSYMPPPTPAPVVLQTYTVPATASFGSAVPVQQYSWPSTVIRQSRGTTDCPT